MKTVLIIEDHPEIRENTAEILELSGFNVITANNGGEGVKAACSLRPDLILCDIMMPQLNGYEVFKQLKTNPTTSGIPFVYVTASTEKSEVKMAMDMGASGYIQKPFDMEELLKVIRSCTTA
jgi:CheY-like chemotaxis protein